MLKKIAAVITIIEAALKIDERYKVLARIEALFGRLARWLKQNRGTAVA